MYRCPNCGSDKLEVMVEVWATLSQTVESGGGLQTDTTAAKDASHEWTDNSLMRCVDCGTDEQIADAFKTTDAA